MVSRTSWEAILGIGASALVAGVVIRATNGDVVDHGYGNGLIVVGALLVIVALGALFLLPRLQNDPHLEIAENVRRKLDSACLYVIKTQRAIESIAAVNPPDKVAPFSPPPDAAGNYGSLSNPEARRAFTKLQELGVIEPTGLFDERGSIVYRWTDLGREVLKECGPTALPLASPSPRRPSEVISDGIRWRHCGLTSYADEPIMEMEALCPAADFPIGIMLKSPFGGELQPIPNAHLESLGIYADEHSPRGPYRLWCPGRGEHEEHEIKFDRSRTWKEAESVARVRLKAQIEIDRSTQRK